jgi:hypothetical protein
MERKDQCTISRPAVLQRCKHRGHFPKLVLLDSINNQWRSNSTFTLLMPAHALICCDLRFNLDGHRSSLGRYFRVSVLLAHFLVIIFTIHTSSLINMLTNVFDAINPTSSLLSPNQHHHPSQSSAISTHSLFQLPSNPRHHHQPVPAPKKLG